MKHHSYNVKVQIENRGDGIWFTQYGDIIGLIYKHDLLGDKIYSCVVTHMTSDGIQTYNILTSSISKAKQTLENMIDSHITIMAEDDLARAIDKCAPDGDK
jgi:hypothetical protein